MKRWVVFGVGLLMCSQVLAAELRFLTSEDAAVAEAKKWEQTGVAKPILSDDGRVLFPFGQYLPTLTCAPLKVCDIELQAGEIITNSIKVGDSARWLLSHALSGSGDQQVEHVIVKPTVPGIETDMIIPTDRRTYLIRLVASSNEHDYVLRMGFYYPEDMKDQWDNTARLAAKAAKARDQMALSDDHLSIDKLDFAYTVDGDAAFKPLRVFNDGTHVYLKMPAGLSAGELPVLVVEDGAGHQQLVNFRVKGDYFIVDKLFDQAVLLLGTGEDQAKVTVRWTQQRPAKKGWW